MDVDGGHCAFRGGDDGELGLWSDVAGCVHSVNTRLLCLIDPQKPAFRIQAAAEGFMKVSREFGAETEEERVAFEWCTLCEEYAL